MRQVNMERLRRILRFEKTDIHTYIHVFEMYSVSQVQTLNEADLDFTFVMVIYPMTTLYEPTPTL